MRIWLSGASNAIPLPGHEVVSAAMGSDAIVHFGADGLQFAIDAANAANVRRFVLVSPDDDDLLRRSDLRWMIVRPSLVYGPGDEIVTPLIKLIRTLPAVPLVDSDREFQPIWYEDLGRILAAVIERNDLDKQILDAHGPELTTMRDLFHRICTITGRSPAAVPFPPLTRMNERERATNAIALLRIDTTPLDHGLRVVADSIAEVLPEEGVGSLEHKQFWADIHGSRVSATALMTMFRERVNEFMPLEFVAEPGAPEKIEEGVTLTGKLPLRGHFQVRVEVVEPTRVVLATVEGHPLAGIVEFTTMQTGDAVRFAIDNYNRASNVFDLIAVRTIGAPAQSKNWRHVVERAIAASGGSSDGVHEEKEILRGGKAEELERRVRRMVRAHRDASAAERAPQR
jgi:NADH dehydrogenase